MNILITGVSGYIGKNLVAWMNDGLVEGDVTLYGTDRYLENGLRVEKFIQCDLSSEIACGNICKNIDCVVHLAGESNSRANKISTNKNNVLGSINLIKSANKHQVRKFIFLSSSKAIENSTYGKSKKKIENEIEKTFSSTSTKYTILRSALVYGHKMNNGLSKWINSYSRSVLPLVTNSDSEYEMISINDLCKVINICITNQITNNKIYRISDGINYCIKDIDKIIRSYSNKTGMIYIPEWMVRILSSLGDVSAKIGITMPLDSEGYRQLYRHKNSHDTNFHLETGFIPEDSFFQLLPTIINRV